MNWDKVKKNSGIFGIDGIYPTECWVWIGAKTKRGYGRIKRKNKEYRAHRISWKIHYGEITEEECVLHKCDYTSCIRPDHLFLGTRADNMQDRMMKGRTPKGELHSGAKLSIIDIDKIRKLYKQNLSIAEITRQFPVGRTAIRSIIYGHTWNHHT